MSASIAETLLSVFGDNDFTLTDAYDAVPRKEPISEMARTYENIGIKDEGIGKSVYSAMADGARSVLIEGIAAERTV